MLILFVWLFVLGVVSGAVLTWFVNRHIRKPEKTDQQISAGILKLINSKDYRPLEYRQICDAMELYTSKERQMAFSEINLLAEEGTLYVSEQTRVKKVYSRNRRT